MPTAEIATITIGIFNFLYKKCSLLTIEELAQHEIIDDITIDLINNDSSETLLGMIINEFSGTWISDPLSTRRAENKLSSSK